MTSWLHELPLMVVIDCRPFDHGEVCDFKYIIIGPDAGSKHETHPGVFLIM